MSATTIDLDPVGQAVTCAMTLPISPDGEHFGPPLVIGYYPGSPEIWIDAGKRTNIPLAQLEGLIRQLRRAGKAAALGAAKVQP